jgi:hypothetical protein
MQAVNMPSKQGIKSSRDGRGIHVFGARIEQMGDAHSQDSISDSREPKEQSSLHSDERMLLPKSVISRHSNSA